MTRFLANTKMMHKVLAVLHAAVDLRRLALRLESGDRHRSLRHCIDLPFQPLKRCHQQGSALQAGGIAHCRHLHVNG
jgi:hypothetical protein